MIPKANLSAFGTWENKASKSKLGQFDKSVKDRLRSCRVHVNNIENSDFVAWGGCYISINDGGAIFCKVGEGIWKSSPGCISHCKGLCWTLFNFCFNLFFPGGRGRRRGKRRGEGTGATSSNPITWLPLSILHHMLGQLRDETKYSTQANSWKNKDEFPVVRLDTYRILSRSHKNSKVGEMTTGAHSVCPVGPLCNHVTTVTWPSSSPLNRAGVNLKQHGKDFENSVQKFQSKMA